MYKIKYDELNNACAVLQLPEKATLAEIKSAHRTLSKKWHPDKCSKKEKETCHHKMKEINKAYKLILKYIDGYLYSFAEEKVIEESPVERWKKQFGHDPLWGPGWD